MLIFEFVAWKFNAINELCDDLGSKNVKVFRIFKETLVTKN